MTTARPAGLPRPKAAPISREQAVSLDRADPLASFRDRFLHADPDLIYLDGNSLGRLPLATIERVARVVEREWGDRLIRDWPERWSDLPRQIGDQIRADFLGAAPGQVVIADSTTVNFYKLAGAALDAAGAGRRVIITDRDNFPTDRYVLEGLAARGGWELRLLTFDEMRGPTPSGITAAVGPDTALVTMDGVWKEREKRGESVEQVSPTLAPVIGRIGLRRLQEGKGTDALGLDANYVRRPDAEIFWKGGAGHGR